MHVKSLCLCVLLLVMVMSGLTNCQELDQEEGEMQQGEDEDGSPVKLQLPMPEEASSKTLQFGETLALDDLGPIIINKDGTLRRITNWSELTELEKKHTLRKVSLRNHKRLAVLKNNERLDIIKKYYEEKSMQQDNESGGKRVLDKEEETALAPAEL